MKKLIKLIKTIIIKTSAVIELLRFNDFCKKLFLPILERKIKKLNNYIIEYKKSGNINEIDLYERIGNVMAWIETTIRTLNRKKTKIVDFFMKTVYNKYRK